MGCLVMDVTFVVERLSSSEWVVVCDPYGLPVKTFSSLDAAEEYRVYLCTQSLYAVPFLSDLDFYI